MKLFSTTELKDNHGSLLKSVLLQLVDIVVHAELQSKSGLPASYLARLLRGEQAVREVKHERHTK